MTKVVGGGPVQKYFSAFQLSYENKTCSECQHDVRKTEKHAERQTDRQTDGQMDRKTDRKTERLFSLGVKTKVGQNVNRMSSVTSLVKTRAG